MAFTLVSGTTVSIASGYSPTPVVMSAITNAAEAVATMAPGHGFAVGDLLEITSGWPKLTGRVVRVKAVATNDVTLALVDTRSLSQYPAGAGIGTVRKITGLTPITQLSADVTTGGGEQNFATLRLLAQEDEVEIPTTRTAVSNTLPVFFDPSLPWVPAVRAARDNKTPVAVIFVYPNNASTVGNAYWGMRETPGVTDGVLTTEITLRYSAQPITYPG